LRYRIPVDRKRCQTCLSLLSGRVTDEHSKTLETLAERINGCLTERLEVIPEKGTELLAALGAYHQE